MRITVDRGRCSGLGICESLSASYFEVGDDGELVLLRADADASDLALLEEAVAACPTQALGLVP